MDLKEKEVESNPNLEVILPIFPQSHSYPLHCPNLGIEVNITKEALRLFSMSKLSNEAIYDVFPKDACYLFFGRPFKFFPKNLFHERSNFHDQTLTLNLLNCPQPQTPLKLMLHKK